MDQETKLRLQRREHRRRWFEKMTPEQQEDFRAKKRAYAKEYYRKNRDRLKVYWAAYRAENPDRIKAYREKYSASGC
jgi:hypothetical protein